MKFKKIRKQLNELNGQTGPVLSMSYKPQKVNINKGLTSFSTVEDSDLYRDVVNNKKNWSMTKNTNSIAIRLPHPKGREADRKDWLGLVKDAIPGKGANLIRGGGLTQSEVDELKRDYKKAAKAFGATKMVVQDHEIYVSHKVPGKLKVVKGLMAMLKALDEFGMRNHVSVSSREGVLTQIQDAAQYEYMDFGKAVNEDYNGNIDDFEYEVGLAVDNKKMIKSVKKKGKRFEVRLSSHAGKEAMEEIASVAGAKLVSFKKSAPFVIGLFESVNETQPGEYIGTSGVKMSKYKVKGKFKKFSPLQKKKLLKHYQDVANGKPGAVKKVMDILNDDVNEENDLEEAMTAAQKKKRYNMIKKAVEKINKQNLERAKKDALKMMKQSGMFDEENDLEEKGKGLWYNIQQRRKSGKRMRKKGEKGAPTAAAMRSAKGESVNEAKFSLVDMSKKTAATADKLAQKVGLKIRMSKSPAGGIQLTVDGTKKKIEKWLQSLPLGEGMYTRDDGGAYDGLRIAKYLAHQDGKDFKRLPYGIMQGYIDDGMEMLKRNKAKARDILSKPTPR